LKQMRYWLPHTPLRVSRCVSSSIGIANVVNDALWSPSVRALPSPRKLSVTAELVGRPEGTLTLQFEAADGPSPCVMTARVGDELEFYACDNDETLWWCQRPPPTAHIAASGAPDTRKLPRALVINMARSTRRWAATQREWDGVLRLVRLEACVTRDPIEGCMSSHLAAMRTLRWTPDAEAVLVLEDDAVPAASPAYLHGLLAALGVVPGVAPDARLPPDWCVANLGPNYMTTAGTPDPLVQPPSPDDVVQGTDFLRAASGKATHCIVYHRRVLALLDAVEDYHARMAGMCADRWYDPRPRGWAMPPILVPRAIAATQAPNYSAIERGWSDHTTAFLASDRLLRATHAAGQTRRPTATSSSSSAASPSG
jgi:hypothetical protein